MMRRSLRSKRSGAAIDELYLVALSSLPSPASTQSLTTLSSSPKARSSFGPTINAVFSTQEILDPFLPLSEQVLVWLKKWF
jgi:hypothetical protein